MKLLFAMCTYCSGPTYFFTDFFTICWKNKQVYFKEGWGHWTVTYTGTQSFKNRLSHSGTFINSWLVCWNFPSQTSQPIISYRRGYFFTITGDKQEYIVQLSYPLRSMGKRMYINLTVIVPFLSVILDFSLG